MREAGTLIAFANRYCEIPIGFKKSSSRTSPGVTGSIFLMASALVIVDDLDVIRVSISPAETDPPLIINSDAVLADPAALQGFQPVARRHAQKIKRSSGIDLDQLSQCDPQQVRW